MTEGAPLAPSPHTDTSPAPRSEQPRPARRKARQSPAAGAAWAGAEAGRVPAATGPGPARPDRHRTPAPRPPTAPELTGTAFSPCCSEAITRMLRKSMAGPEHGGLRQPPRQHRQLPPARRPLGPARFRPLPPTLYIASPGARVTSPVAEPGHGKRGWERGGNCELRLGSPAGRQGREQRRGRPYEPTGAAPALPRAPPPRPARPGASRRPPLTAGAGAGNCPSIHLGFAPETPWREAALRGHGVTGQGMMASN